MAAAAELPAPSTADPFARRDRPILELTLRPNRSMTWRDGAWVVGLLAAGLAVPLVPLAGTAAAWGMLPFLVGALVALYWAIRRNMHDGLLTEELRLWPDLITVVRREPSGEVRLWHAHPFWVRLRLLDGERVEKYLTLQGNGREIELGAFLSPGERQTLYDTLGTALSRLKGST
jgi:uncharacterized membrane protein